ncbi:MAG: helix-turn-helix domain-containing protein, partial [Blastococcus sp.]
MDEAILDAARAELAERGYARMSIDAVAARAGVSKPTVYLRHATKADLATAAIASMRAASRPAPTGDVRADLIA